MSNNSLTCFHILIKTYGLMGLWSCHAYKSFLYLYFITFFFFSVNSQMSLSIDETYDASLNNQNNDKFKKYKEDIEKAVSVD